MYDKLEKLSLSPFWDRPRILLVCHSFSNSLAAEYGPSRSNSETARLELPQTSPARCFAHLIHSSANARQSFENHFGVRAVCFQIGLALRRNAVELPSPLLLHAGMTDLMQLSQRGINHAWARRIESARTFFEALDQLIAVRWLFGEQRQYHQLNVDRVELAPARKIAAGEVARKSKASTTESAAPMMMSESSRVSSAIATVFAAVGASVSSGVFSVAFATMFAAEGSIETC